MKYVNVWKRRLTLAVAAIAGALTGAFAQVDATTSATPVAPASSFSLPAPATTVMTPFSHWDITASAGSTGIGIDVATPLCSFLKVRAGFAIMPHIDLGTYYNIQVGSDYLSEEERDSKFQRLAGYLEEFTGYKVDQKVGMDRYPTYYNGKLVLDVYPFRNKNWYLSAGIFYGNEDIAKAYNRTDEMATLVAVGIYNKLYDQISNSPVLTNPDYFLDNTIADMLSGIPLLKRFGFDIDPDDETLGSIYLDPNTRGKQIRDAFQRIKDNGRMGIRVGNYTHDIVDADGNVIHKAGDPYMMEPNEYSMVKGWVKVNKLKPYVGFGYNGPLQKDDDRWRLGFDCGVLFWGGTPRIMTHEGIDMSRDIDNIMGSVRHTVNMIKFFKAFPVADLRLTYRLGKNVKRKPPKTIVVERIVERQTPFTNPSDNQPSAIPLATGISAAATTAGATDTQASAEQTLRRDIFFAFSSASIADSEEQKVVDIAQFLKEHPSATVTITGYADKEWGDSSFNKGLSERRAAAVADCLANRHAISRSRITVVSKGDSEQPYRENKKNRVSICIAK